LEAEEEEPKTSETDCDGGGGDSETEFGDGGAESEREFGDGDGFSAVIMIECGGGDG
ncbi:hypothetical protein Tco_0696433, partial [Tanacetum coccineum]